MQHTGHMNARTRGQPLLVVCRLLVGVASVCLSCSNDAAPLTGPGDATQVAPDVLANCPVLQRRGVGSGQTCCPAGHIYDFAGDRCVAVGPPECAATMAACRPDPAACPADPFGGIPTKQGTLFVDASAPAGGDGSRPKPLRTIGAAIAKATVGATIAVAKGVYPEPVVIPFALNLRGRCAALVVIKPPLDNLGVRVEGAATSARVVVSGVTIADTRIGISAPSALPSRFERVWVHDADLVGAYVRTAGGDVELVDVVIADTAGSKFNTGAGVLVTSGAKASLERVRLHRNTVTGVAAENVGSMITLRHVRVDDTRPGAPIGRFGFGLKL